MTACRNKARGAVVAALAGALTLGAAPVMALADGASLMAADADQAFNAGTVTEFTVGNKKVSGNDAGEIKFGDLADSAIKITSVRPDAPGDPDEVDTSSYTTYYYKKLVKDDPLASHQINGEWYDYMGDSISSINSPGEYVAAVTPRGTSIESGGANNVRPTVSFTVVADEAALQDAQLMKVVDVDNDVYSSEVTWEYGKTWQSLRVVAGGEDITAANTDADETGDIKVEVYATGQAGDDLWASDASIVPGSYQVVISGVDGAYAGAKKKTYEMTVGKLDLSKLGLYIEDVADGRAPTFGSIVDRNGGTSVVSSLMGSQNWVAGNFDLKPADGKTWGTGENGSYAFSLTLKDDVKVNGTGSKLTDLVECDVTLELNRVKYDKTVAWSYDGHEAGNVGGPSNGEINVDASLDEDSFSGIWQVSSLDLSKFAGSFTDENGKKVKLSSDQVEKTIYDADGNVVDSMSKKGVYYVVLECDPADFGYGVKRSTYTIKVTWKQGDVTRAGTTFTFDGKVVQSIADQTYDGRNYLDRIGIQVRDDEGNLLEESTDYDVVVTKDGKEVDSIVDAGNYEISVTSDLYEFATAEKLTFTVNPFDISTMSTRVVFPTSITYMDKDKGEQTFVPYTGSDITPVVEVALTTDEEGEQVWTTLDSALYDLGFDYSKSYGGTYKDADSVKELGYYKVSVYVDGKATDNFKGSFTSNIFNVDDRKVFVDVDSAEYYAPYVYTAVRQGYVEGMGGSNLFAPNASVSRADMVVILYRMAGGDVQDKNWTADAEETEYLSQFGDIKGNEYFAQALAWASRLGIVTGYEDGNFGPADSITVEQFATMLARYAKVAGSDMDVNTDEVLAGVADGSQVSQFAEDAVAWAIDNGYLAQGGADIQPQSPVSRGRAVTIAVRYQPEQLQDSPVSPVE